MTLHTEGVVGCVGKEEDVLLGDSSEVTHSWHQLRHIYSSSEMNITSIKPHMWLIWRLLHQLKPRQQMDVE